MIRGKSIVARWHGEFDEDSVAKWVSNMRREIRGPVSLGLVFISPKLFNLTSSILEIVRIYGNVPALIGCSACSNIVYGTENEDDDGFVVGLYSLPGAEIKTAHITMSDLSSVDDYETIYRKTGVRKAESNGWIAFSEPFSFDVEWWLEKWNCAYPGAPVIGGIADGFVKDRDIRIFLDGEVYNEGCVLISIGGKIGLKTIVSQAAKPLGDTWTITRAEDNVIYEIANMPALEWLGMIYSELPRNERKKLIKNFLVGLAVNEYKEKFEPGDFLIRGLIGGDPQNGFIEISGVTRPGQSIQVQQTDSKFAIETFENALNSLKRELRGVEVHGGCLFCSKARDSSFYKEGERDSEKVQEILGPIPLVGFLCNGEFGPANRNNYLHFFSAVLGLFVTKYDESRVEEGN